MLAFFLDSLRSALIIDDDEDDYAGTTDVKANKDLAYFHFNLFIDECEEGNFKFTFVVVTLIYCTQTGLGGICTLQELLAFFTGSNTIPPQGFGKKCRITFNADPSERLPTASTCALELRLPTCHEDYGTFREWMILAIRGCGGTFGQI